MKRLRRVLVRVNVVRSLVPYRTEAWSIVLIALLAGLAALGEAVTLMCLVPVAQRVAGADSTVSIGPISPDASSAGLLSLGAFLVIMTLGLRLGSVVLQYRQVARWERKERDRLAANFLFADWPTQQGERVGRIQQYFAYVSSGSNRMGQIVTVLRTGLSLAVLVASAFVIEYRVALLLIVLGALMLFAFRPVLAASRRAGAAVARAGVRHADEVDEAVALARDRHVFGGADQARATLRVAIDELVRRQKHSQALSGITGPVYQAFGMLVVLGLLGVVVNQADRLTFSSFGAATLILLRGLGYGQQLQSAYQRYSEAYPFVTLLDEINSHYESNAATYGSHPVESVDEVELRGVTYRYDDEHVALQDVSLRLYAGDRLGIVGPSGAGKSTLAQVLLRLRSAEAGEIHINGISLSEVSTESWFRLVSYVPQDVRLFHGTVAENIAFFRPFVDHAMVRDAATRAGIAAVIESLPQGYDTLIGPTTRDLSGGQIQRIGIARALAGRPRLLVLDEPTSALDQDSERIVHDALDGLEPGTIVVIIAHRPSTIRFCNRIAVIDRGRVAADGDAQFVAATNQFFARLMQGDEDAAPGSVNVAGASRREQKRSQSEACDPQASGVGSLSHTDGDVAVGLDR